ncbi:MAG TPA: type IV secretion system protein, partial [Sphingomonas sp.]|nr:type IV secretion system protein [Sphingomonas sp.]
DAADHALFGSATLLFLSTVGVLAMAKVATAMLTAIGPIFIALLLFEGTRGLFVGWVRALIAVALVPLLSGATTVVALLTLRPALEALSAAGASAEAASRVVAIVQIFAGAQALLLVGCALLAAGFRLPRLRRERTASASPRAPVMVHPSVASPSRAARLAEWVAQPRNARPLLVETGATMIAAHHLVRGSAEPIPRALRLGEANRRPAFRPRRAAR